jgi:hypothetical protein
MRQLVVGNATERVLCSIESLVHLLKTPLIGTAFSGTRTRVGVSMIWEWKMTEYDAHVSGMRIPEFFDAACKCATAGTFKVTVV